MKRDTRGESAGWRDVVPTLCLLIALGLFVAVVAVNYGIFTGLIADPDPLTPLLGVAAFAFLALTAVISIRGLLDDKRRHDRFLLWGPLLLLALIVAPMLVSMIGNVVYLVLE